MHTHLLPILAALFAAVCVRGQWLENHPTWKHVQQRTGTLCSRDLFGYAFKLCENNTCLDRLDELFHMAVLMQDRDPKSPHYGNYRWSWKDGMVMDTNAVEFCMETGALIWIKHRDKLTPAQQKTLLELYDYSIKGCLNHKVPPSYTNIALMNFQNLILLGETFKRQDILTEGLRRLDAFMVHTAIYGISEYSSPTYSGVDLGCLQILWQFTQSPDVKAKTDKLLRLFWTELAASAFPPAACLAGAHSRDYDYLYGRGAVDAYLQGAGIVPTNPDRPLSPESWLNSTWRPDDAILKLATTTPRTVCSTWGEGIFQNRTLWAGQNVTLSSAGAGYHNMDIPLTVTFAADHKIPRAYFIADGRRDPYGKKLIPESSAHMKTLHLKPLWGAVQRQTEALGLVLYRPQDLTAATSTLESHFVFPAEVDEIRIGDQTVSCTPGQPFVHELKTDEPVFVRLKAAAFALRVPFARDVTGATAKTALVWDNNPYRAARITVAHQDTWGSPLLQNRPPAAAFWLRVCDNADKPDTYAAFCNTFASATARNLSDNKAVAVSVDGLDGELALQTLPPYSSLRKAVPAPSRDLLSVNGTDLGRQILSDVPGVQEHLDAQKQLLARIKANEINILPGRNTIWEAEKGLVTPAMTIANDDGASSGQFVWTPGNPGERGGGPGSVAWQLNVLESGTYYIWGRVAAPTPEDDSFFLALDDADGSPVIERSDWNLTTNDGVWSWDSFPARHPVPVHLDKGRYTLRLHTREDGTKVDQMAITSEPNEP